MEHNPLIVALDGMDREDILRFAQCVQGKVGALKVNDAIDRHGPSIIADLMHFGPVFADMKVGDIPNTTQNRVKAYVDLGASYVSVLAAMGGVDSMMAAVRAAEGSNTQILAVTVLTSLDEESAHLLYGQPSKAAVLQMARNAVLAGVPGLVCSPQELAILKKHPELKGLFFTTPGIRPAWHQKPDDQRRVMTPAEAIKAGAKYLVIGRPFTEAEDPVAAIERTLEEIAQVAA